MDGNLSNEESFHVIVWLHCETHFLNTEFGL